jgi:SH3-like domain-containing protein
VIIRLGEQAGHHFQSLTRISFLLIVFFIFIYTPSLKAGCVFVKSPKLYSKYGYRSPVSWKIRKYMPLKIVGGYKKWYKVADFEGDRHWIPKKHVTKKFHCAVVKVENTTIRTGPSFKTKKKFTEASVKYDTFVLVKGRKDWAYVRDVHGDTGWIYRKHLWVY